MYAPKISAANAILKYIKVSITMERGNAMGLSRLLFIAVCRQIATSILVMLYLGVSGFIFGKEA